MSADWAYGVFESPTGTTTGTNQLSQFGTTHVTHDAAGNREVAVSLPQATLESWLYDATGRSVGYGRNSQLLGYYVHDANGQRTSKTQFDSTGAVVRGSWFYYDQDGHLISEFIFHPNGDYELVLWVWLNDVPIVQNRTRMRTRMGT